MASEANEVTVTSDAKELQVEAVRGFIESLSELAEQIAYVRGNINKTTGRVRVELVDMQEAIRRLKKE